VVYDIVLPILIPYFYGKPRVCTPRAWPWCWPVWSVVEVGKRRTLSTSTGVFERDFHGDLMGFNSILMGFNGNYWCFTGI